MKFYTDTQLKSIFFQIIAGITTYVVIFIQFFDNENEVKLWNHNLEMFCFPQRNAIFLELNLKKKHEIQKQLIFVLS